MFNIMDIAWLPEVRVVEALAGTIALDAIALDRGASIIRVHDVKPAADTVKLLYQN